jgi:hypothetical protein
MLDLRFVIGVILAAAVLAVTSFALYATIQVMRQAKQGVVESSRIPPLAAAEDWHRHQSLSASPGPPDGTVVPDAVSIVLNALPKGSQGQPSSAPDTAQAPLQTGPQETAAANAAAAGEETAATAERLRERATVPISPAVQAAPDESFSPDAATGSVPAPPAQEKASALPGDTPARVAPRIGPVAPARRVTSRPAAPERDNEPEEQRPSRRSAARVSEHRQRTYVRPWIVYQPARRSLYGGNYWQPFGY